MERGSEKTGGVVGNSHRFTAAVVDFPDIRVFQSGAEQMLVLFYQSETFFNMLAAGIAAFGVIKCDLNYRVQIESYL